MAYSLPDPYPEIKPAMEFIGGRLVQKMSRRWLHAHVQRRFASALGAWADARGSGRVGTEWDFDLMPPEESVNRLVPDVAYLSYGRVAYDDDEGAQIPRVAPDVAVEILSPGQTLHDLAEKISIFLASGSALVIVVDPRERYALLYDAAGARRVECDQHLTHPALPEFDVALGTLFEKAGPASGA